MADRTKHGKHEGHEDQDQTRTARLEQLAQQLRRLERSRSGAAVGSGAIVSTGWESLDAVLPGGGLRRGTLVEWVAGSGAGSGAATLALLALRGIAASGWVAVVDRRGEFYPPAAAGLGIGPRRVLIVRPGYRTGTGTGTGAGSGTGQRQARKRTSRERDEWFWAVEQVLRSPAIDAVLAWAERLDDRAFRRWQLAVEAGGGVGMLIRPRQAGREPSWAAVRLGVRPLAESGVGDERGGGRRWAVRVLRGQGGGVGGDVRLELHDETGRLHLLPELVRAASSGQPAAG